MQTVGRLFCTLIILYLLLQPPSLPSTELEGQVKVTQTTDMVDFARRFGLEMLVRPESVKKEEDELLHGRTRATVDEVCPDCGAQGMEFYTLQLRSADEGQTVFYECTECGHKHSTNN